MNVKMSKLITVCADMDTRKINYSKREEGGEKVDSVVNKAG